MVVVEGRETAKIKQAMEEIGGRLARHNHLFVNLLYKVDPGSLREKGLQFLSSEILIGGLDRLRDFSPILNGHWELITLKGVVNRLQRQLQQIQKLPEIHDELLQHAELLTTSLVKTLEDRDQFTNPWPEILQVPAEMRSMGQETTYLLNEAGTMGFVMATAVPGEGTFEGPTAAIDMIRKELSEARRTCPQIQFRLTGISVLENDEMRRSMADSTTASIISFVGVAVILLIGFRGVLHPCLGLAMLAASMAWSFGYTTFAVGHLNILSVSFAAMLMGLGIDFAIHILSRYLELRHEGHALREALVLTADSVGVGIITGAVTTSLAFFCATMTEFLGVAELGVIAGGGILLCALAAFTILPAIIDIADRKTGVKQLPKPFEAKLLRAVTSNHPLLVTIASLACVGYIGYRSFDWSGDRPRLREIYDHNLLHLQADGLESVEAQKHIFESSKHSLLFALSVADSAEHARELKTKFEQLDTVHQVQELATRLPQTQSSENKLLIQAYAAQLAELPAQPPEPRPVDPVSIGQALERLYDYLKPRTDARSQGIVESIDVFLDRLEELSAKQQLMFLSEFQYRMSYALLAQFQAIAAAANPDPVSVDDLPKELRSRFVSSDGKWLLQIYPKNQIWEMDALERFVKDVRSVDPEATGTPLQNYEAARQIKLSYEICALFALGVILITLLLDFAQKKNLLSIFILPCIAVAALGVAMQSGSLPISPGLLLLAFAGLAFLMAILVDLYAVGDCLLAMMPPILGMGMTYGLLVICGLPLNPANLIILPLILGIGVDNGVHILHDFHSKPNETYRTSASTINAIMLTSVTTMVGFGSMMVSAHRGLYSLGAVLTIGVGACLFVSLVTLPALLALMSRGRDAFEIPADRLPASAAIPVSDVAVVSIEDAARQASLRQEAARIA